jgi:hypothetical protein
MWMIFGVALSLTPLVIVAGMGWMPVSGASGFMRLLCNEEMLAIALTLGGAAAADVLTNSAGRLRPLKLVVGGLTFIATIFSAAGYVIIKTHSNHLGPDLVMLAVAGAGGATLAGALACEILAEV